MEAELDALASVCYKLLWQGPLQQFIIFIIKVR